MLREVLISAPRISSLSEELETFSSAQPRAPSFTNLRFDSHFSFVCAAMKYQQNSTMGRNHIGMRKKVADNTHSSDEDFSKENIFSFFFFDKIPDRKHFSLKILSARDDD